MDITSFHLRKHVPQTALTTLVETQTGNKREIPSALAGFSFRS